jgi:nicotinate-nucleotide pyrophosphorylase (carboxylating)
MGTHVNMPGEQGRIDEIVARALREDLGVRGDVTSRALFDKRQAAAALIKAKEAGVLSGVYLLKPLFGRLDSSLVVTPKLDEGARLREGSEICALQGSVRAILAGERTALNLLQRLSGIATCTARFVALLAGTRARLLDTRKTTPSLRILEKKAVLAGGGFNHRFGLFDMILIKDTHIRAAGGIASAVRKAKSNRRRNPEMRVEVEVQSFAQFEEAVAEEPDRIMLDNMPCKTMARCVAYLKNRQLNIETEASGNVTEQNIARIAQTGIDFISSGRITHSARALDIHLVVT